MTIIFYKEAFMSDINQPEEEDVTEYTQGLRKRLAESLVVNGEMPKDLDSQRALLATLDGLDRTSLAKKRLKNENKLTDTITNGAGVVEAVMARMMGKDVLSRSGGTVPVPPTKLVETVQIADGELDQGTSSLTYDEFITPFLEEKARLKGDR